jgi:hypothetical protein
VAKSGFALALLLAFVVFLSAVVATARAEAASTEAVPSHPFLNDRFIFEVGGFYSKNNTNASLSPPAGGAGVIVNFEDTLGLDSENFVPIAGFQWRFAERWRLEAGYFKVDRSATRTLATDVTWGDKVFPVGSTVSSSYDMYDVRTSVGYSFFRRPDKELGVGVGLHTMGIKTSLEAAGIGSESSTVTAPLPVLNLYGTFALTNEWAMRVRMDWLSLSYDQYSGDIRSTLVDVIYQPFRNVGFGLGMRNLIVDLDVDATNWQGKARTSFSGPNAFITVSF